MITSIKRDITSKTKVEKIKNEMLNSLETDNLNTCITYSNRELEKCNIFDYLNVGIHLEKKNIQYWMVL